MSFTSKYHATTEQISSEFMQIEAAKLDVTHFGPIYDKYYKQIFGYIYQRMEDKELAFDITSQVFFKALTNLHKYEFRGVPFSSWLYRIAHSEVMQVFNTKKAQRTVNADVADIKHLCEEIHENYYEDFIPALSKAMKNLSEDEVQLIEMRFFENRAFKEIAEILMMTESNAKVKLYRTLERIKKILKK